MICIVNKGDAEKAVKKACAGCSLYKISNCTGCRVHQCITEVRNLDGVDSVPWEWLLGYAEEFSDKKTFSRFIDAAREDFYETQLGK